MLLYTLSIFATFCSVSILVSCFAYLLSLDSNIIKAFISITLICCFLPKLLPLRSIKIKQYYAKHTFRSCFRSSLPASGACSFKKAAATFHAGRTFFANMICMHRFISPSSSLLSACTRSNKLPSFGLSARIVQPTNQLTKSQRKQPNLYTTQFLFQFTPLEQITSVGTASGALGIVSPGSDHR